MRKPWRGCRRAVQSAWSVSTSAPTRMPPTAPPNTPGLRDLQAPAALDDLLARVLAARAEMVAAGKPSRPIVVKLAPDIAEDDLEPIVNVLMARGVDGIAVSNSTLARKGVSDAEYAAQAGGLSGPP